MSWEKTVFALFMPHHLTRHENSPNNFKSKNRKTALLINQNRNIRRLPWLAIGQ